MGLDESFSFFVLSLSGLFQFGNPVSDLLFRDNFSPVYVFLVLGPSELVQLVSYSRLYFNFHLYFFALSRGVSKLDLPILLLKKNLF